MTRALVIAALATAALAIPQRIGLPENVIYVDWCGPAVVTERTATTITLTGFSGSWCLPPGFCPWADCTRPSEATHG